MSAPSPTSWKDLGKELRRRTRIPLSHATFVTYFVGAVVIIGGLGIWVEALNAARAGGAVDLSPLRTAIATVFLAMIGSACFQLILGNSLKQIRAVAFFSSVVAALIGLWLMTDDGLADWGALLIGGGVYLYSLWIWWITNADNGDFLDHPSVDDTIGGDVDQPLTGDLDGFDA